jgi:GNAT superfamily N-acetyltransferase
MRGMRRRPTDGREASGGEIRSITEDELFEFLTVQFNAYGRQLDPRVHAIRRGRWDVDQCVAMFVGGQMVATGSTEAADVTVPGPEVVPAVIMGNLAVRDSHRNRGLAREVLSYQFRRNRAMGHPFAVFSVTRPAQRLHTQLGSSPTVCSIDLHVIPSVVPAARDGRSFLVRGIGADMLAEGDYPAAYRSAAAATAGGVVPGAAWLVAYRQMQALLDGRERLLLEARDAFGSLTGYATALRADGGEPQSPPLLVVDDLVCTSSATRLSLIGELGTLSEGSELLIRRCRVDDAVRWWVRDHGCTERTSLHDSLWIRIFDVRRALEARRYFTDDRVTVVVHDELLPESGGALDLVAAGGVGRCVTAPGPAEAALEIGALGALYFGSTSAYTLAAAGLISTERTHVLDRLDRLFSVPAGCSTLLDL